jgi:hypothetical protein
MSYRNKTYVIFDGDNDMTPYAYMKGWKQNDNIDFDFHDAHAINEIRNGSNEETVKRKLRERLANTKQAIVLIGENTKNLYRYVRWEIECCIEMGIPIVAVNLNGLKRMDDNLCPAILKNACAVHIPFKMKIIKHALDNFCPNYRSEKSKGNNLIYPEQTYINLGIAA